MKYFRKAIVSEAIGREERIIAAKLFRIRTRKGIQRAELAEMVGIEEKKLAEYESAIEPVAASDLYMLATAMGINIEYFYEQDAVSYAPYYNEYENALLS